MKLLAASGGHKQWVEQSFGLSCREKMSVADGDCVLGADAFHEVLNHVIHKGGMRPRRAVQVRHGPGPALAVTDHVHIHHRLDSCYIIRMAPKMFSDAVMFRPPHETYGTEWTRQFALSDQRGKDPRHFQVAADAGKVVGASRVPAIIVSVNQHRRKRGVSTRNLRPNHVIVAYSNI